MKGYGPQSIFKGTLILTVCRFSVWFLGLFEILLLAGRFGTSIEVDAYLMARSISLFLLGSIESSLFFTFVPVFVQYMEEAGDPEAWAIADSLFLIFLIIFGFVALGICLSASFITKVIAAGFSGEAAQVTAELTRIMAPLLILIVLSSLLSSTHYCYHHFAVPAVTSVLGASGAVIGLLFFTHKVGIYALPLGLLVTQTLQLALLLFSSRRYRRHVKWRIQFLHPGVRQMVRLMGPRFLENASHRLNLVVDRFFASFLGTGYIAALHYAERMVFSPVNIINVSLGKSLMPSLSRYAVNKDLVIVDRTISNIMRMLVAVFIPLLGFLVLFREEIIVLLFQRGRFDAVSTQFTAYALLFYSFGIIGFCFSACLRGVFFSFQDTWTPLKVSTMTALLNIVLDFFLMKIFSHGGIALATSIVVTINALILWILMGRKVMRLTWKGVSGCLCKCLAAITMTGLFLAYFPFLVDPDVSLNGPFARFSYLSLKFALGVLIYVGICRFLRVEAYGEMWRLLVRHYSPRKQREA